MDTSNASIEQECLSLGWRATSAKVNWMDSKRIAQRVGSVSFLVSMTD